MTATASTIFAKKRGWMVPILVGLALLSAIFASLCVGAYPMSFWHSAKLVLHLVWPFSDYAPDLKEFTVVKIIRPPRILLATLAGMGLGMSGTALQGMFRNPLVSPDIVGVTSGAAFGAALAISLDWSPAVIMALGCCTGMMAMACTFSLAKMARGSSDGVIVILCGVFIGAFLLALLGLVEFWGNPFRISHWIIGSFANADWVKVWTIAVPTVIGGAILMTLRWRLNLLSLSDLDAQLLGINVGVLRWTIIAVVSVMVASQVAVSGVIALVGLVVPHSARMLVGPDHRRLLPTAALIGALFVLALDDLNRSSAYAAMPVGALSAIVGTPVVCFLLWRSRGRGWTRE
jgi:iron complex transport system permease protein